MAHMTNDERCSAQRENYHWHSSQFNYQWIDKKMKWNMCVHVHWITCKILPHFNVRHVHVCKCSKFAKIWHNGTVVYSILLTLPFQELGKKQYYFCIVIWP